MATRKHGYWHRCWYGGKYGLCEWTSSCGLERYRHLRMSYRSLVSSSTFTDTCNSAQPRSTASLNSNDSPFANKGYNPASNAVPFSPLPDTPTHTRPTVTPAYVRTTLRSSSEADTRSSVVEQCRWKWKPVVDYSSTCSLHSRITSTISLASHHAKSVICLILLVAFPIRWITISQ